MLVIYLLAILVWALIWGFATRAVIYNKGYSDNWFWWGFFFGFIAFIVALSKGDNHYNETSEKPSIIRDTAFDKQILADGGWKCSCGRINYHYVSTCACGKSKTDVVAPVKTSSLSQEKQTVSDIEAVKKYKELLDAGIITQEEFDIKKKQLLKL
ncbi:SHOCT domain-containing protein [Pseudoflavonifractor phocaeensis]|uniref:SHOCT domain-containing protein n=1 Tax=Pseudoflavonifractor phocaeensis TaxID=1870988 RepID=UPI00195B22C1|nr:SHOCT domain-containing protein [Pseudoflavonifractor phocaeensis]MBM6925892.1 SHOCT domain-containing protein [Pseudoflavonifractor phocaeensis]